jgi:hypothetical protein
MYVLKRRESCKDFDRRLRKTKPIKKSGAYLEKSFLYQREEEERQKKNDKIWRSWTL